MLTCARCSKTIPEGQEIRVIGRSKRSPATILCQNCAEIVENKWQAETENPNLLGAVSLALGAGGIIAVVWYLAVTWINHELGLIAVVTGWLIAQAAMLGSGRKRGRAVQIISAVITLLVILLNEYLVLRYFLIVELKADPSSVPILLPVDLLQFLWYGIKLQPLNLLFWAIGLYLAFVIPTSRQLQRSTPKG